MSEDTQHEESAASDVVQLQKERDEYLAGWKRALADFSNREKELVQEKRAMAEYASRDVILEMLPVLDNLKTALTHLPAGQAGAPVDQAESEWVKGVGYVVKQMEGVLNNYGVRAFASVGQKFDPARHEAVGEEKGEGEVGTILKEAAAGYMQNDTVIRPAKVIVSKNS